jgi:D-alanyl-D-alanine carboxypeptidase (penicillin-binding protein 5/6)
MAIPTFRTLVAMPQVSLPMAGVVYNLNFALGTAGINGIKVGDDTASGASYLFEAQEIVGGSQVTLIGAVLDQQTVNPLSVAIHESEALVQAAFGAITTLPALPPGKPLAKVVAPWGASVPVDASTVPEVVGLPGAIVRVHIAADKLAKTLPSHALVGQMTFVASSGQEKVMLRTTRQLGGPSVLWRLTRL